MEKRINQKTRTYLQQFKNDIQGVVTQLSDEGLSHDNVTSLLQFIYDYPNLELAKEDLVMEAISAWLNLMKTYNVHEANKKIEANALKTLSMTIEKVKKGEASKLEQLQIEQQ